MNYSKNRQPTDDEKINQLLRLDQLIFFLNFNFRVNRSVLQNKREHNMSSEIMWCESNINRTFRIWENFVFILYKKKMKNFRKKENKVVKDDDDINRLLSSILHYTALSSPPHYVSVR